MRNSQSQPVFRSVKGLVLRFHTTSTAIRAGLRHASLRHASRLFQESSTRKRHVTDVYRTKSDKCFQECLPRQGQGQDKVERISDSDISGDGTMLSFS